MNVGEQYLKLKREIAELATRCGRNPDTITLVAVTKMSPLEHVLPAYESGCRDFGENRVQEALGKISTAPNDLNWHLIGTLQKNKVRKVIGKFALIHSVDRLSLAEKISSCSEEEGIVTLILLEANTSGEEAKHGLTPEEWRECYPQVIALQGIKVEGFMTMAPFVEDEAVIRDCFRQLRLLRDELQPGGHLSMGMTHDYPIAIEEGATLLRIGTAIFGP